MARAGWSGVVLALAALVGCEADPTAGEPAALAGAPELVSVETVWTAPPAADGETRHRLAWRWSDERTRPLDLEAPAVAWTAWRHGAAVVDSEHRLWRATPDGHAELLQRDVGATPAVSPDGTRLVYAVAETPRAEVRLHDGRRSRVISRATRTAGRLRFAPSGDAVALIGAGDGGVAGVWVAPTNDAQARCLSNCELVTGEPWGERFVPLPPSAESFRFEGERLSWPLPGGGRAERAWKGAAP